MRGSGVVMAYTSRPFVPVPGHRGLGRSAQHRTAGPTGESLTRVCNVSPSSDSPEFRARGAAPHRGLPPTDPRRPRGPPARLRALFAFSHRRRRPCLGRVDLRRRERRERVFRPHAVRGTGGAPNRGRLRPAAASSRRDRRTCRDLAVRRVPSGNGGVRRADGHPRAPVGRAGDCPARRPAAASVRRSRPPAPGRIASPFVGLTPRSRGGPPAPRPARVRYAAPSPTPCRSIRLRRWSSATNPSERPIGS